MNTFCLSIKYFRLPAGILILLTVLYSCKKEAEAEPDLRDVIVGRYEVIDSIYRPGLLDTLTGVYPLFLDKVLHHPLVEASKGVFFMDDKTWKSGVLFKVIQKDDSTDPNSDQGFADNRLFQVQDFVSGSLLLSELGGLNPGNYSGTFKNNEIFIVFDKWLPRQYCRSHLKRLP